MNSVRSQQNEHSQPRTAYEDDQQLLGHATTQKLIDQATEDLITRSDADQIAYDWTCLSSVSLVSLFFIWFRCDFANCWS